MIWIWVYNFLAAVRTFFAPPAVFPRRAKSYIVPIDPNAMCPGCGHRNGSLKCIALKPQDPQAVAVAIQHSCKVCGAHYIEPTVVKSADRRIQPGE